MREKYKKYLFFITLSLLLFKGCGIFDTRDPEDPQTVRSTFIPPTTADIVLDNLTFSIQEKNSDNYNKCVSPSNYRYIPDAKSQLNFLDIFAAWNPQSEKKYLDNLITDTPTGSSVVFFDNSQLLQITSDSAIFQSDYVLVFQHRRTNIPKSAKGKLTITIATDSDDLFYIRKWEDFRQNDTDFTWSEFKGNFSN